MEKLDHGSPQSFTVQHDGIVNELKTKISVSHAFDPQNEEIPTIGKVYFGIWDTGATNSVISQKVVYDFKLTPVDMAIVHHAGGVSTCNVIFSEFSASKSSKHPFSDCYRRQI